MVIIELGLLVRLVWVIVLEVVCTYCCLVLVLFNYFAFIGGFLWNDLCFVASYLICLLIVLFVYLVCFWLLGLVFDCVVVVVYLIGLTRVCVI